MISNHRGLSRYRNGQSASASNTTNTSTPSNTHIYVHTHRSCHSLTCINANISSGFLGCDRNPEGLFHVVPPWRPPSASRSTACSSRAITWDAWKCSAPSSVAADGGPPPPALTCQDRETTPWLTSVYERVADRAYRSSTASPGCPRAPPPRQSSPSYTHLEDVLRYTFHRRVIVCVCLLGHRGSSRVVVAASSVPSSTIDRFLTFLYIRSHSCKKIFFFFL